MTSSGIQKRRTRSLSCSAVGRMRSRVSLGRTSNQRWNSATASGASISLPSQVSRDSVRETIYTPGSEVVGFVPHLTLTMPSRTKRTVANASAIVVGIAPPVSKQPSQECGREDLSSQKSSTVYFGILYFYPAHRLVEYFEVVLRRWFYDWDNVLAGIFSFGFVVVFTESSHHALYTRFPFGIWRLSFSDSTLSRRRTCLVPSLPDIGQRFQHFHNRLPENTEKQDKAPANNPLPRLLHKRSNMMRYAVHGLVTFSGFATFADSRSSAGANAARNRWSIAELNEAFRHRALGETNIPLPFHLRNQQRPARTVRQ